MKQNVPHKHKGDQVAYTAEDLTVVNTGIRSRLEHRNHPSTKEVGCIF